MSAASYHGSQRSVVDSAAASAHGPIHAAQPPSRAALQGTIDSSLAFPAPPASSPLATNRSAHTHNSGASSSLSAAARQPLRAPNPAKKVTGKDELRTAITRQAVAEGKAAVKGHTQPAAATAAPPTPPLPSPTPPDMATSRAATYTDLRPTMAQRTVSIDSTVSSISSVTNASQRPNGASAVRSSQDSSAPQDPAALIAAHGSAEAALQKLIAEKQQAASHNAQLWRLVEKQRAMILGLNKDLEKSLKEKERYRRKLKDHVAQSSSAPALTGPNQHLGGQISREDSQSPSINDAARDAAAKPAPALEGSRKASDSSDTMSLAAGRSDTPQDIVTSPAPLFSGSTHQTGGAQTAVRDLERTIHGSSALAGMDSTRALPLTQQTPVGSPAAAPKLQLDVQKHQRDESEISLQASPSQASNLYSSPKTRKAPPAPLRLEARPDATTTHTIASAGSDSEYQDDPESARSEFIERGRRKTREDDDREREFVARQEEEQRSRSLKDLKNKNKLPAMDAVELPAPRAVANDPTRADVSGVPQSRNLAQAATANPAEMLRMRAVPDATGLPRSVTAPSLLSPGLPMSPRPGDRPMNSPRPRAPNAPLTSMPMSPKSGLLLSPRPPTKPIPLPPQNPLSVLSPHLDRVQGYPVVQPVQTKASAAQDRMKPISPASLEGSPDLDHRPSTSSDLSIPGEIFRGLVTEQYPDLLLPPNALPSIYVKTSSSRMRPSRHSLIGTRFEETPIFTLAVYERSGDRQLWRVEKSYSMLIGFDTQIRAISSLRDRYGVPDKVLFQGHSPAKVDARRQYLNRYFERLLDAEMDEKTALVACKFLSADAIGADLNDPTASNTEVRPDTPVTTRARPTRAGYLTKRGKNFGGWKARYFVLDGPSLKYFEGPGGALLGSIKLQNSQIGRQSSSKSHDAEQDEEHQFRHAFLILEPKKKDSTSHVRHVLCAESDAERDGWVESLLQYVEYRDSDELEPGRYGGVARADFNAPISRSPRAQKSFTDLRSGSVSVASDAVRGFGYSDVVAGDAPTMGPPQSPQLAHTPSPPYDRAASGKGDYPGASHPTISGPSNAQLIQNAGDWGMKPPPTPNGRDKKRGVFQIPFKARSSSDMPPMEKAPLSAAHDRSFSGVKAVFGAPLAEAVEVARPPHIDTDLPAVFYRCIEYLVAKNAVNEEGIFRLSGSTTVIKALRDRFNNEGDIDLLREESEYDIHAVASLLKMYLRELPSTILTRDLHLDFLQVLETPGDEKIFALNALVNRLPSPNRSLLDALSAFLLMVVDNAAVNKMNVRNLGVVFSPTLNVPGPLISLFVEEQHRIFGSPLAPSGHSPTTASESSPVSGDLRSPRKQMFSDLPTPAYNQISFSHNQVSHPPQSGSQADDTGMIPMRPSYAPYQMAPQGDGGFGSLNDVLRSPTVYSTTATGAPTSRAQKRESGMLLMQPGFAPQKKTSNSRLREQANPDF